MEAQVLRIPEAAQVLNMGQTALRAAIKRREVPSIRIGGLILIPKSELEAMMQTASKQTAAVEG